MKSRLANIDKMCIASMYLCRWSDVVFFSLSSLKDTGGFYVCMWQFWYVVEHK